MADGVKISALPTLPGSADGTEVAIVVKDGVTYKAAESVLQASKAPIASPTFTGTVGGIDKTMVGLGNVDNTSDANKPVSTDQATAIGTAVTTHETNNKHDVSYLNKAAFPVTGVAGIVYLDRTTGIQWFWNGTAYQMCGWNATGTALVDPVTGADLLTFDTDGNIISSVIPRTDTLAGLLAEVAAGDGEIGVATDQEALVVFKGDPSVPIVYRPSSEVAFSKCVVAVSGIITATPTTLLISATGLRDQAGIIDSTNDVIVGLLADDRIEVDAEILIVPDSGGTYRKLWLEQEVSPGVWDIFGDGYEATDNTLDGYYRFNLKATMDAAVNVRMRFQHDAGANRNIALSNIYVTVRRPAV